MHRLGVYCRATPGLGNCSNTWYLNTCVNFHASGSKRSSHPVSVMTVDSHGNGSIGKASLPVNVGILLITVSPVTIISPQPPSTPEAE